MPKPGFSGLKNLWVTRVFGFGKTRVGNPNVMAFCCDNILHYKLSILILWTAV